jgi:hypothetical protein
LSRRIVVSIDTLIVNGIVLEPKAFEAALRRELGTRLAGRVPSGSEPRDVRSSDGLGRKVASTVHRELSR